MTYEVLKGIILAGGNGSRLAPLTNSLSKQLLPVYDKPMIYYPLSTLMLMGIKDILIITTERDQSLFKNLLGSGKDLGIKISYEVQQEPRGIPHAFIIGEKFIKNSKVVLILGDNIFYGHDLISQLISSSRKNAEATIFAYAKKLVPSKRGELEITDLNNNYLEGNKLNVEILGRGIAWLDTGTFESLQDASLFIKTLEMRQGLKIGCPEEVAWRLNYIDDRKYTEIARKYSNSPYGNYLKKLLNEKLC